MVWRLLGQFLVGVVTIGVAVLPEAQAVSPQKSLGLPSLKLPSTTPPVITTACDTLKARLEAYSDLARQNEENIAGYLGDLSQVMKVWHRELSPLEGHSVFIEKGSFDPIRNTSDNVAGSSQTVRRNSDDLAAIVKEILIDLPGCLK